MDSMTNALPERKIDWINIKSNIPQKIQKTITNIKNDISYVLEGADFEEIINYLRKVYVFNEKGDKISQDIKDLFKNFKFRTYIKQYIEAILPNILNNDSIYSFEEISFFVFLLWAWEYNNILIDLNTYDFEKIKSLFDFYIKNIIENIDNFENNNIFFELFMLLLELMNKLSILNQIDIERKPLIIKLASILEEKIIDLESKLLEKKALDLWKKSLLQHFLWKLSINFSHISYVETKGKSLNDILWSFLKIVEKQNLWYIKSLSSNFWNNIKNKKIVYETFLWNMAYTINIMVSKIDNFNHDEILSNDIFKTIVSLFLNNIEKSEKIEVNSLQELIDICNNIYISIYNSNQPIWNEWINHKKDTWKELINDFISNKDKVNDFQIESIHHLIMFLPDLSLEEYIEVWKFLINIPKFNSFNFEFFKLKILDIIIWKIPLKYITPEIKKFLENLVFYIENNKIASQLLATYFRLYLSISFYYSELFTEEYQDKAMEYFVVFLKMWWLNFNFGRYWKDLDKFYYNIWLYKLNVYLCDCIKSGSYCDPSKEPNCNFSSEQIIKFWEFQINDYRKSFEIKLKNDLDSILSDLLEDALNQNGIEDSKINQKVSKVLSNKIFHWIAEIHIVDVNSDKEFIENIVLHNWISTFQIDLFNGYRLFFVFPKIYNKVFKDILDWENDYIVKNIKNIISSYLKRKDLYVDHNTWLPNELRLKTIISHRWPWVFNTFISIKLNTLKAINNWYGYELWDKYLKKVVEALSSIDWLRWNIFRLSWAKIWIMVNDPKIIDFIIKSIKNIKFKINWIDYRLDCFIWVVMKDDTNRIIDKSIFALDHAKSTLDWVYYYQEDVSNVNQNRWLLEYLNKLDIAIEDDRIIPFAQAIYSTRNRELYKNEILMRVKTPEWDFESPWKYLQVAEKFWKLISIFNIILKKVFEYAYHNQWNFSINLSGDDLDNEDILTHILEIHSKYPIDLSRITFEILEWEWSESAKHIKTLKELKKLWFKMAMDDFWASNSNVNRLLDLLKQKQIDYIKIDWKIVRTLVDEDKLIAEISKELLEWIINAAHSAWVKVIAEFVENEKIAIICEVLGVDYLQWNYLWEPSQLT